VQEHAGDATTRAADDHQEVSMMARAIDVLEPLFIKLGPPDDLPAFPPEPPGQMPPPGPPPVDPHTPPETPPSEPQPIPVQDPPRQPEPPPMVVGAMR
jgi:hypothetical protein